MAWDIETWALEVRCEYCKAEPGYWCVTSAGNKATWLHGLRTRPFINAWDAGYAEGELAEREYAERCRKREADRIASRLAANS